MSTTYGNLFLVTEVKLRIVWREFTHNVRTTIEGKFAVATMVAAPFLMKSLLVSSALRQASMSKHSGWVELLPCGLVHPTVLAHGGLDPEKWSGWAFGLGLSRLVMMKYRVEDIRHLMAADLRFISQFRQG